MKTLLRFLILVTMLTVAVTAQAYWKDRFPATPFETVTKEKIKDLKKQIKTLIPMCTANLEQSFGKVWKRNRHGFPRFLSVKVINEKESQNFQGFAETHGSFFIGMTFSPYPFISGQADLETTVCHEVVHAYFRKHMRVGTYARLPRWAREGGAVYLVNQISHKERHALSRLWSGERESEFNGLEGPHDLDDYYEDALAFTFLREKYAADHRVLSLVLEGKNIYDAIEQSTGLNQEAFLREALLFAQEHVTGRLQSLSKETREAIAGLSTHTTRYQASREFLRQFKLGIAMENIPSSLDFGMSMAFSLDVYSDDHELIKAYERVLREVPSFEYGQNVSGVRYKLAGFYLKIADYRKALHYFTLIFNENVEVPILQQSATEGILRSYVGLADWRHVLAWSENERGLHPTDLVEYRYYRALAYRALGNAKKAHELFELVCASVRSRFQEKACQALSL